MNEITIRDLDNASVQSLRKLAWRNGRPVEEIARSLLIEAARAGGTNVGRNFTLRPRITSRCRLFD